MFLALHCSSRSSVDVFFSRKDSDSAADDVDLRIGPVLEVSQRGWGCAMVKLASNVYFMGKAWEKPWEKHGKMVIYMEHHHV